MTETADSGQLPGAGVAEDRRVLRQVPGDGPGRGGRRGVTGRAARGLQPFGAGRLAGRAGPAGRPVPAPGTG